MKSSLTVVIKVGSASLVDSQTYQPIVSTFESIADLTTKIRANGHRVILVSSGAVAIGRGILKGGKRGSDTTTVPKRALAAVGQSRLTALWEDVFAIHSQPVAQVLLDNDDQKTTKDSFTATLLNALLDADVVPIVNENDALTLRPTCGNDVLALTVATAVKANVLAFLTDVDCLYTRNPRVHPDAEAIEVVTDCDELDVDVSSLGTALGTGGMALKLFAARLASSVGITTIINNVSRASNIAAVIHNIHLDIERRFSHTKTCHGVATMTMTTGRTRRRSMMEEEEEEEEVLNLSQSQSQSPSSKLSTSIHTIFLPSPSGSPKLMALEMPLVLGKV